MSHIRSKDMALLRRIWVATWVEIKYLVGLAVVLILRTFNFGVFLCSFVCLQELPEFVGVANVDESLAGDHSRKQFPCFSCLLRHVQRARNFGS